jgi:hypothetical protein
VHSSTRPIGPGALAAVLRTAPVCLCAAAQSGQ